LAIRSQAHSLKSASAGAEALEATFLEIERALLLRANEELESFRSHLKSTGRLDRA
jgi:hypothetical protein